LLWNYASLGDSYNPLRSITGGFLHADLWHLLGNMWFLYLFGSSAEGKLGHLWMAGVYTVCLVISDLAMFLLSGGTYRIALGASGAVGGIIGAYWFLFSRAQVEFFYWIFWAIMGRVWLPVLWAVIWLFGWDLLFWFLEAQHGVRTGVGHTAHLGGVVCGFVCGLLIRQYSYVTLDGDDMLTRCVKCYWAWRRGLAPRTAAPPPSPSPPAGRVGEGARPSRFRTETPTRRESAPPACRRGAVASPASLPAGPAAAAPRPVPPAPGPSSAPVAPPATSPPEPKPATNRWGVQQLPLD
jgi:membrane associated rhomboid family serine protease